jgi:RNA polymerase sigma factor (sigma-70 family)
LGKTPCASREAMLIRRATSGAVSQRREAENTLIAEFEPELSAVIRSSRVGRGLPSADALQSARYGLLQAIRRFNPASGVRLWTYARPFVISQVARDARSAASSGLELSRASMLHDPAPDLARVEDRITCVAVLRRLSSRERFILVARYLSGVPAGTLARHLSISPAAVSLIERRAVNRINASSLALAA